MDVVFGLAVVFVGLPWVVLHHVTKWKTAATLTNDDETMLEELYQLARRLEERMETVERLAADNDPEYRSSSSSRSSRDGGAPIDFNESKERIRR
jgi:phage shock protein B